MVNAPDPEADARDVADYETRFEIYAGLADYGKDARQTLRRLADEYRALVTGHWGLPGTGYRALG